jgi:hypothetical protein
MLPQDILSHLTEERKLKAWQIVAVPDGVSRDDTGNWQVLGQAGKTYLVSAALDTCTCPDHKNRNGHTCKHQGATALWLMGLEKAPVIAQKNELTIDQLALRLLYVLNAGVPMEKVNVLTALYHAATYLANQPEPQPKPEPKALPAEITLVIQYHTSGGRNNPVVENGKILEAIEDGKRRRVTTGDLNKAYAWLQSQAYEPVVRKWQDPAGSIRRRNETFARKAEAV